MNRPNYIGNPNYMHNSCARQYKFSSSEQSGEGNMVASGHRSRRTPGTPDPRFKKTSHCRLLASGDNTTEEPNKCTNTLASIEVMSYVKYDSETREPPEINVEEKKAVINIPSWNFPYPKTAGRARSLDCSFPTASKSQVGVQTMKQDYFDSPKRLDTSPSVSPGATAPSPRNTEWSADILSTDVDEVGQTETIELNFRGLNSGHHAHVSPYISGRTKSEVTVGYVSSESSLFVSNSPRKFSTENDCNKSGSGTAGSISRPRRRTSRSKSKITTTVLGKRKRTNKPEECPPVYRCESIFRIVTKSSAFFKTKWTDCWTILKIIPDVMVLNLRSLVVALVVVAMMVLLAVLFAYWPTVLRQSFKVYAYVFPPPKPDGPVERVGYLLGKILKIIYSIMFESELFQSLRNFPGNYNACK